MSRFARQPDQPEGNDRVTMDRLRRHSHDSDAELVALTRRGDAAAREALVRRYLDMVHGLAFRLLGTRADLEDVVQETFVRALDGLDRLEQPEYFGTWLGKITINVARQTVDRRRRWWRRGADADVVPESIASSDAPADVRLELERVYHAIGRMPERLRTTLVLRRVEGLQLTEIADAMDTSLASVKRWLAKAEAYLTKAIGMPMTNDAETRP